MELEKGQSPFTAYVDSSFNPEIYTVKTSPTKVKPVAVPGCSELEDVLRTRDHKKIKAFVREGGWSPKDDIRRVLWWRLSCVLHKDTASASIYDETVKDVFGEGASTHNVTMPSFVDLSTKQHYHLSEAGTHIAKKVICILGTTCPDVTYAPLVYPLTCLLLHFMDESDCYNCVYGLLRTKEGHLMQTKKAHQIMKFVLKELTKKYAKQWYVYTCKKGLQPEGILDDWIWWIFRDIPFTHLVRILDCYLVEGPKVLYRAALAILNLFYKHVVKMAPSKVDTDMERALSQFCEELPVSPDKLLKMAFAVRGLSRKEIHRYHVKSEMYVESLKHAPFPQTIHKSDSCESLNLKVSRSFSGPVNLSALETTHLTTAQVGKRGRSCSQDNQTLAIITRRCKSDVIDLAHWQVIWRWLPTRITLYQPVLLYTSNEHGTSLNTFYSRVDGMEPTLLIIKTSKNEVIGAYCSDDWANRVTHQCGYFGTGESFVFSLTPRQRQYPWVGLKMKEDTPSSASLFLRADNKSLCIGGGAGMALSIDEDLCNGRSEHCMTFGNQPLVEGGDFSILTIEVFGFSEPEC